MTTTYDLEYKAVYDYTTGGVSHEVVDGNPQLVPIPTGVPATDDFTLELLVDVPADIDEEKNHVIFVQRPDPDSGSTIGTFFLYASFKNPIGNEVLAAVVISEGQLSIVATTRFLPNPDIIGAGPTRITFAREGDAFYISIGDSVSNVDFGHSDVVIGTHEIHMSYDNLEVMERFPDGVTVYDCRIWDRRLSDEEIVEYRNRELDGTEPGLVRYWKLNEGTGTTITEELTGEIGTLTRDSWAAPTTIESSSDTISVEDIENESYDFIGLESETLYEWRIRQKDDGFPSDWTEWQSFTTLSSADDIFLVSTSQSTTDATSALFQNMNITTSSLSETLSQSNVDLILRLLSQVTGQSESQGMTYVDRYVMSQSDSESQSEAMAFVDRGLVSQSDSLSESQITLSIAINIIAQALGMTDSSGLVQLDMPVASDSLSQTQTESSLHTLQGLSTSSLSASDSTGLLGLIAQMDASSLSESAATAMLSVVLTLIDMAAASSSSSTAQSVMTFIRGLVSNSEAFSDASTLMGLIETISATSESDSDSIGALGIIASLLSDSFTISDSEALLGIIRSVGGESITVSELFGLAQLELSLNGDLVAASQMQGILEGIIDRVGYITIDDLNIKLLMDSNVNIKEILNTIDDLNIKPLMDSDVNIKEILNTNVELKSALDAQMTIKPKR